MIIQKIEGQATGDNDVAPWRGAIPGPLAQGCGYKTVFTGDLSTAGVYTLLVPWRGTIPGPLARGCGRYDGIAGTDLGVAVP